VLNLFKKTVHFVLVAAVVSGCSMANDPNATTYVIIDPADTERLMNDLTAISKAHGLTPYRSSASPEVGRTYYYLEASGRALNIWVQNMPLSGEECPEHRNPGPDSGQFIVVVRPAMWFRAWGRAHTLFKAVKSNLEAKGYKLLSKPSIPCEPSRQRAFASDA
jgi:hypothetical protein